MVDPILVGEDSDMEDQVSAAGDSVLVEEVSEEVILVGSVDVHSVDVDSVDVDLVDEDLVELVEEDLVDLVDEVDVDKINLYM